MFFIRSVVVVLVFSLYACRCEDAGTSLLNPELLSAQPAVSFEACPTQDEAGQPVADVFPDEKRVTLQNLGKAGATLGYTLVGPDKATFSLVEGKTPAYVDPTSEQEISIRFSPTRKGDAKAELVIEDGSEATEPLSIALIGTGKNLPAQPSLEASVEDRNTRGKFEDCYAGGTCLLQFPDTFYKQATTLSVKLKNKGCPALKIKGMELIPLGASAGNLAFFLDEPALVPTATTPLLLTTADGLSETTLKVRFSPEDDGSGSTQRFGYLRVLTNDPSQPEFDIQLLGNAAEPSVYSQPAFCDFSQNLDPCGYPTRQPNKARFEVKNGGNVPLTISEVKLAKGGQGRFTITQNVLNQTLAPGGSKFLEVSHTDAPVYVTELLTVRAVSNGLPAGEALITLAGGIKPCLSTEPSDQLDFEDASSDLTKKTVVIKNGPGCGDLIINNVATDASQFFSVVEPLIPQGQLVPANGTVTATVQYKKPVSGGTQAGVLRIMSNDPDFGPPPHKVVRLYSNSPLDQLPIAVLEGCNPSSTNCVDSTLNVSLTALGNTKQLLMNGSKSFDPPGSNMPANSKYLFRLVSKPSNATNASLANDGQKSGTATAVLTLDSLATGLYRVTLTVFDDKNQPSASASELKIFVTQ